MHVAVIGSGRSGTSMITRMLNLAGLNAGRREETATADFWNPKGYWEHSGVYAVNQDILTFLGGSFDNPPKTTDGWEYDPALDQMYDRARRMLDESFGQQDNWLWKLPPAALTLPFWKRLVPDLRFVICVRNPLDFITSIGLQSGMARDHSVAMWTFTNVTILAQTDPRDRQVTFYEDYFPNYREALFPLLDFLGLEQPRAGSSVDAEMEAFHDVGLKHFESGMEDLLLDEDIPYLTKELYMELRVSPPDASELPILQQAAAYLPILSQAVRTSAERSVQYLVGRDSAEASLRQDELARRVVELDCRVQQQEQILGSRVHRYASLLASLLIHMREMMGVRASSVGAGTWPPLSYSRGNQEAVSPVRRDSQDSAREHMGVR